MNKEEILSKSRKENRNKDLYKLELQLQAGNIGSLASTFLATLFFVTQSVMGGGFNFGLYAIITSVTAATSTFKAIHLKRRWDILWAIVFTALTLFLTVAHMYGLVTSLTA